MKTIIIYPGRFQPFGKHHYETYKWAVGKFGVDNVYISTSDFIDEKSPLNFEEKSGIIQKYGIMRDRICKSDRPYMPTDLLNKFDKDSDRLIVIYGEKDYGRLSFQKKDGTPAYFKKYVGQHDLQPFKDSAYVSVAPHVRLNHNGNEICGTYLRQVLPTCNRKEMFDLMGWTDERFFSLFKMKFQQSIDFSNVFNSRSINQEDSDDTELRVEDFKTAVEASTMNKGRYTKHIMHPFECSMSFSELKRLVFDLTKNVQAISQCSLKLDGYNFQVTVAGGKVLCSRNKTTVLSPMTYDQLKDKYSHKPDAQYAFCESFKAMEMMLSGISQKDAEVVFNKGRTFLNFEIIHDRARNVFKFSSTALYVHSLVTYYSDGNESHRSSVMPKEITAALGRSFNGFLVSETPKVEIKPTKSSNYFINKLLTIQHRNRIPESTNIMSLPPHIASEIRMFILEMSNDIIKTNCDLSDTNNNVNGIIQIIEEVADSISNESELGTFEYCMEVLNRLGGYKAINPVEGLVFIWGDRLLKLTGSFGALVPIFNLWNKKRF